MKINDDIIYNIKGDKICMENNKNINNKYVSIDSLYNTFSDSVDLIPMIISTKHYLS